MRGCIIIYHYLLRTANYLISFPLKQFAAVSSVDTSTGAKEKECVSAGGEEGAGKLARPHDVASLRLHHKRGLHTTLYTRFAGNERDYWYRTWNTAFKSDENVLPADEYAHVVMHSCDVVWDGTQTYRVEEGEKPFIRKNDAVIVLRRSMKVLGLLFPNKWNI